MMYTLKSKNFAFEQMDRILKAVPERRATFAATLRKMATTLQAEPRTVGESRAGSDRVWFVDNLVVMYTIHEESRVVRISSVRLMLAR